MGLLSFLDPVDLEGFGFVNMEAQGVKKIIKNSGIKPMFIPVREKANLTYCTFTSTFTTFIAITVGFMFTFILVLKLLRCTSNPNTLSDWQKDS